MRPMPSVIMPSATPNSAKPGSFSMAAETALFWLGPETGILVIVGAGSCAGVLVLTAMLLLAALPAKKEPSLGGESSAPFL